MSLEKIQLVRKEVAERYKKVQTELCRSLVRNPLRHCLFHWCMMFFLTGLVVGLGFFAFADFGITDFVVITERDVKNFLALNGARDLTGNIGIQLDIRSEALFPISFNFLYESSVGPLISKENIQEICEVEKLVTEQKLFTAFCLLEEINTTAPLESRACAPLDFTITKAFYEDNTNCDSLSEQDVQDIFSKQSPFIKSFLYDDVEIPTVGRSIIQLAGPLGPDSPPFQRFNDTFEDFDDPQVEDGYKLIYESFFEDIFEYYNVNDGALSPGFSREFFQRSNTVLEVRTSSTIMETLRFIQIIAIDQALSIGSYFVVLVIMSFYVKSFCYAFISMIAVLLSMPIGLFLFRVIFQIDYFTPLNILVLFLIAGIGADNVFVMHDAWKQSISEVEVKDDVDHYTQQPSVEDVLFKRLSYAYNRAALSVSQTAITTFIAFLATAVSPIDAIAGLGLYASLVILVNLWYMFTVHPANLMFYHVYIYKRGKKNDEDKELTTKQDSKLEIQAYSRSLHESKHKKSKYSNEEAVQDNEKVEEDQKQSRLKQFLESYVFLLNETKFPFVSLLGMLIISIIMITSTLQLETPSALESNFPDDHMFTTFSNDFNELFTEGTADSFTLVEGVFGVKDLDIDGIPKFSGEEVQGTTIFDDRFEMFSKESQDYIKKICRDLLTLTCEEEGCTRSTLVRDDESFECFLLDFEKFIFATTDFAGTHVDALGGIPTEEEFFVQLDLFFTSNNTLLSGSKYVNQVGIIDGEIKFHTLSYRMTMKANQPLSIKTPVIELFDDFTALVVADAPPQLESFYQTSFDHVWQHTERAFVSGLFTGLAISLTVSFFVLLIGTKNGRVAMFAIIGVGCVAISVLGTVRFRGYSLGTAESVAGVFVIGLAVDYIVHLGHMFMHSREYLEGIENPDKDNDTLIHRIYGQRTDIAYYNKDMVAFAVRKMGGTVIAGAITTFCSAAFLSLCTFAFFGKMSILLMLTIFYSISFAFLYFLPMLRVLGPGLR